MKVCFRSLKVCFMVIWELTKIALSDLKALLNENMWSFLKNSWKCFCFGFDYFWKLLDIAEWFDLMGYFVEIAIWKLHILFQMFLDNFIGAIQIFQFLCFGDCMIFCCSQDLESRVYVLIEAQKVAYWLFLYSFLFFQNAFRWRIKL